MGSFDLSSPGGKKKHQSFFPPINVHLFGFYFLLLHLLVVSIICYLEMVTGEDDASFVFDRFLGKPKPDGS